MITRNQSIVCLKCKEVSRISCEHGPYQYEYSHISCPNCGNKMLKLGDIHRVPKKNDSRGWKKFVSIIRKDMMECRKRNIKAKTKGLCCE
jgi:hypothetical protein